VKVAEPGTITIGEEKNLSSDDELTGAGMYSFVPKESGLYAFYSYNNSNNSGIHGAIYDSEMNSISEDWQSRNSNFYVYSHLEAGETYYLKCSLNGYWSDSCSYSVKIDIAASAERIELSADSTEVYIGTNTVVRFSYYPLNAMSEYVNWSVSDNSVAIIQWGDETQCQIDFVSGGTVTLSATTENGLSDSITFTVSEPNEIVLGAENTVNIASPYNKSFFKFTPQETAVYSFSTETDIAEFEISDQYESYSNRFQGSFSYRLDAGETYYLYAGFKGDIIGEYTFTVTRPTQVTSIEILSLPDKLDYYEFESWFDYRGLELKITDENGCEYYWSDWGDDIGEFMLDIYPVYYDNNYQYTEISCGGATNSFKLNIQQTPISSIVINKAPEREYFYGDTTCGYFDEDSYYLIPLDIRGIEFTVNYTNGTSVMYGDDAFENGDLDYNFLEIFVRNGETFVGQNTVVFSYMNVEATYEVTVKEDTVISIELTKVPDSKVCYEYFAPDLTGAEFTITYNDSTTETVAVTSENQGYDSYWYDVVTLIPVNGSYIIVSPAYDEDNNPYYVAEYLSQSCRLDCFSFAESKEIDFIGVDNFNIDLENTAVTVIYTDSSTESFPLNVVEAYGGDEFKQIFCRSDKGVFCVMLDKQYDPNGYKEGYRLAVFDYESFVSDPFGDVNGDGVSDIRDLVHLKKLLAKATEEGAERADLDGDGNLSATDIAELRRYLIRKTNVSNTPVQFEAPSSEL
ncbi:MAG: dockerin type I repeat-containing protein, partial [Acutalibacteraceae bacterium]